ncbi:MAG: bifunctional oligoribonuclease/PAP phosphatase NrnA [Ruminococcaceae bacterium]|nr:bifunctional oligoribonuclease/PAP phosphatase NrnA [Oscillospiraceae bacterium]
MNSLQDIIEALKQADRIAVYTHTNPDGDALGSAFAIKAALSTLGKIATVFLEKPLAERYNFLNTGYSLSGEPSDFDVALALDCGSINRLGQLQNQFIQTGLTLVVDHHYADMPFGDLYYSDPSAAACCELVYELTKALCNELPTPVLTPLYTGLSTDTGHFKFSNVTAKTFTIASELLSAGLEPRFITRQLYDTVKLSKLKFTGALAEHVQLFNQGKIGVLLCYDSFLAAYGLLPEETEELPNVVLSIEGVEVSIIIKNKEDSKLKISLRCKENIDMAQLAAQFGGGGHACAAGFVTELSPEEITQELVAIITKQLEEFNACQRN